MKLLSKLKRLSRRSLVAGLVTATALGAGVFATSPAHAAIPGGDCDTNAVIRCGVGTISDLKSKDTGSVADIFSCMGISRNDIQSLPNHLGLDSHGNGVVAGSVNTDNNVLVNGNIVATSLTTGGRQNISNQYGSSRKVDCNGTPFYERPLSVSAAHHPETLASFVVMKNGIFQYAVMNSCGNPVVAKPKLPTYQVSKLVSAHGANDYHSGITVKSGAEVDYKITVTVPSSSPVPAANILVKDVKPGDVHVISGSLKRDGSAVNESAFFGSGVTIPSLAPGHSSVFTFQSTVGNAPEHSLSCKEETLPNLVSINVPTLPTKTDTATTKTTCTPPVFTCNSLTPVPDPNDVTKFTFNAAASASNGASITGYTYDFGDGNSVTNPTTATTNSATHQYTQLTVAKTYTVTLTVLMSVNGTNKSVTGPKCQTSVTVPPQNQTVSCTGLTLTQDASNPLSVLASASYAPTSANLTTASFNWGDGNTGPGIKGGPGVVAANHTYAVDGTYTVVATLNFTGTTTIPAATCQQTVTIQTTAPVCQQLNLQPLSNDTKTVTTDANNALVFTANNSTFSSASLDWGDGSQPVSTTSPTGLNNLSHTYAANGPYNMVAKVTFMVNGQPTSVTSAGCSRPVSFNTIVCTPPQTGTPPNCVTPTCVPPSTGTPPNCVMPPTTLVNTGAGSVAGLFAAASILGAFIYRRVLTRRLLQE